MSRGRLDSVSLYRPPQKGIGFCDKTFRGQYIQQAGMPALHSLLRLENVTAALASRSLRIEFDQLPGKVVVVLRGIIGLLSGKPLRHRRTVINQERKLLPPAWCLRLNWQKALWQPVETLIAEARAYPCPSSIALRLDRRIGWKYQDIDMIYPYTETSDGLKYVASKLRVIAEISG